MMITWTPQAVHRGGPRRLTKVSLLMIRITMRSALVIAQTKHASSCISGCIISLARMPRTAHRGGPRQPMILNTLPMARITRFAPVMGANRKCIVKNPGNSWDVIHHSTENTREMRIPQDSREAVAGGWGRRRAISNSLIGPVFSGPCVRSILADLFHRSRRNSKLRKTSMWVEQGRDWPPV